MKNKSILYWLIILIIVFSLVIPAYFLLKTNTSGFTSSNKSFPAFPGAEGYGSETQGGRFGKIVFVTNLNDTVDVSSPEYPGSFRWAIEHTWSKDPNDPYNNRRIIIFKTGGTINLVDKIIIRHPYVTIAGQTAPGDGILLRGDQLTIATHDVIIRGIRVRVGDEGSPTCCRDGINISTTESESDVYNIIIDHSSVSWAIDENISTYANPNKPYTIHDITIQWNIVSEGLQNSIHIDEGAIVADPHSMGMIVGQNGYDVSIHHNLFANNSGRNPRISGIVNSEVINNVIYGWKNKAVEISEDVNVTHILNNYFILGLDSRGAEIYLSKKMNPDSQVYIEGNTTLDLDVQDTFFPARIDNPDEFQFSSNLIFKPSGMTISSSEVAYEKVLSTVGAIVPFRDEVDRRVVNNVVQRTGRVIDSQEQVGGWPVYETGQYPEDSDNDGIPDSWEMVHDLNMYSANDANNPGFLAPSGYTWLEEYMNSLFLTAEINSKTPSFLYLLNAFFKDLLLR